MTIKKVGLLVFLATAAVALECGCRGRVLRTVKVMDTSLNIPATNRSFVFFDSPKLDPLVQADEPIRATLDANGEARVQLRKRRGWVTIEVGGTNYVTSLESADIIMGGQFPLYAPRPLSDQTTNVYPSKYRLEIRPPEEAMAMTPHVGSRP